MPRLPVVALADASWSDPPERPLGILVCHEIIHHEDAGGALVSDGCHTRRMKREAAEQFAEEWVRSWNDHDLEGVLRHFADSIVFTSPHAAQLLPSSGGVVRGKDSLRRYWQTGLKRIPDLRFEVLGVFTGVDTIVINYRNQRGDLGSEVLTFADGLVIGGHGTYIEAIPYHEASAAGDSG